MARKMYIVYDKSDHTEIKKKTDEVTISGVHVQIMEAEIMSEDTIEKSNIEALKKKHLSKNVSFVADLKAGFNATIDCAHYFAIAAYILVFAYASTEGENVANAFGFGLALFSIFSAYVEMQYKNNRYSINTKRDAIFKGFFLAIFCGIAIGIFKPSIVQSDFATCVEAFFLIASFAPDVIKTWSVNRDKYYEEEIKKADQKACENPNI